MVLVLQFALEVRVFVVANAWSFKMILETVVNVALNAKSKKFAFKASVYSLVFKAKPYAIASA